MPDAEALIGISKLLEVPVSKLLGAEVEQTDMEDLTEELARVNEQNNRPRSCQGRGWKP